MISEYTYSEVLFVWRKFGFRQVVFCANKENGISRAARLQLHNLKSQNFSLTPELEANCWQNKLFFASARAIDPLEIMSSLVPKVIKFIDVYFEVDSFRDRKAISSEFEMKNKQIMKSLEYSKIMQNAELHTVLIQ